MLTFFPISYLVYFFFSLAFVLILLSLKSFQLSHIWPLSECFWYNSTNAVRKRWEGFFFFFLWLLSLTTKTKINLFLICVPLHYSTFLKFSMYCMISHSLKKMHVLLHIIKLRALWKMSYFLKYSIQTYHDPDSLDIKSNRCIRDDER